MPKHRILFEFASTPGVPTTAGSDAGWTESFWDNTDLTEVAVAEKADLLRNARLVSLTGGWSMTAIRISILDGSNNLTRRGQLIKVAPANGNGGYDAALNAMDEQPWDAINLSIATLGGARRAFLMRGIGSNVIAASGRYAAPARFVITSALFATALRGGGGAGVPTTPCAVRTRSAPALTTISNVLTVSPAAVNLVASDQRPLIRVPIMTVQAGNTVSITGVQDMLGVNGQWIAAAVQLDPTNVNFNFILLQPRRRNTVAGTFVLSGTVRYWNWTLDPITGFTIGNGASRRTGRPPQQRRGRRSARRS